MSDNSKPVVVKVRNAGTAAPIWFIGWLFSIGYLHLVLPKALYALLLWPYYLGVALAK